MTIASPTARADYPGAGSVGPFATTFRFAANTDLEVIKVDADGVAATLTYATDYTVTGANDDAGGDVTLVVALAVGEVLSIRRNQPLVQATSFKTQGRFAAAKHEALGDLLTMGAQQQQDQLDRSIRVPPVYDPTTMSLEVPPSTGAVLGWTDLQTLGNLRIDTTAVALPGEGRTVETLTAYLLNNRVFAIGDYLPLTGYIHGTSDAQPSIDAACAAASAAGGGVVQLREGTYLLASTLSIPAGVTVRGMGMGVTTLKRSGTTAYNVVQNENFTGTADAAPGLADLTLDGNKASGTGLHVLRWTNVARATCTRVRFTGGEAANVALYGNSTTPGVNTDVAFLACISDSSGDSGLDLSDCHGGHFDLTFRDNVQTDFNVEPRDATESVKHITGTLRLPGTAAAASGADIGVHFQGYSFATYEGVIENVLLQATIARKDVGLRFEGANLVGIVCVVAISDCREHGVLGMTGAGGVVTTGVTVAGLVHNCGTAGAGATYYSAAKLEACTRVDLSGLTVLDDRATKLHDYGIEETAASADNNVDATIAGWRTAATLILANPLAKQTHGQTDHFGLVRVHPAGSANSRYRGDLQRTTTKLNLVAYDDTGAVYQPVNVNGDALEVAISAANDETYLLVKVDRGGVETLSRVTIGAADSGGAGYRLLRVAN
jgi:hypothetical protein